jgi:hypothetical protein
MHVRLRMEPARPARPSGLAAAGALAGAAALHAAWAAGSPFPAPDQQSLADLVVGTQELPGPAASAAVAGALGVASVLVARQSGWLGGPSTGGPGAAVPGRVVPLGAATVAAVLLARGAGGLVVGGLGVGEASARLRRWDARLYSPLCLALGAAAARAAWRADG